MNDGLNAWRRAALFSATPIFNDDTKIYIMPKERSVDIDEEIDFVLAEFFLSKQQNGL